MKDVSKLPDDLVRMGRRFRDHQPAMLKVMGIEAVNETGNVFRDESFGGKDWPGRLPGTPRDDGRALLTDTGILRRSVRYEVAGRVLKVGVDLRKVPYAQIHNEGGTIAITPQMRKFFWARYAETKDEFYKSLALTKKTHLTIPQRQFIGITKRLEQRWRKKLSTYVRTRILTA